MDSYVPLGVYLTGVLPTIRWMFVRGRRAYFDRRIGEESYGGPEYISENKMAMIRREYHKNDVVSIACKAILAGTWWPVVLVFLVLLREPKPSSSELVAEQALKAQRDQERIEELERELRGYR